jgi:UDP-N-acetylglucosamine 2-epimerase (non-hydrolysing)
MPKPTRLMFVFGTRPEAIKFAPLVRCFARERNFGVRICVTGQHREMLDQVLSLFDIRPDHDLGVMTTNQGLPDLTAQILARLQPILEAEKPDWVFVQGDTTTTFIASLAAFYAKINVAHLEAGLRTGNKHSPYPEEMNRLLTSRLADVHFAPTEAAAHALRLESIPASAVHVTGNTVVDALLQTIGRIKAEAELRGELEQRFGFLNRERKLILVTAHRRESFGAGFESLCRGLSRIVTENREVEVIFPVHLNPNVREPVHRILGAHAERVHLIEPVDYLSMVYLMDRAYLILSDSGGVQEEAPSLRKPLLVLRDTTERPEALLTGGVALIGTQEHRIVAETTLLLKSDRRYEAMRARENPFGDGRASERIVEIMSRLQGSDHAARETADAPAAK